MSPERALGAILGLMGLRNISKFLRCHYPPQINPPSGRDFGNNASGGIIGGGMKRFGPVLQRRRCGPRPLPSKTSVKTLSLTFFLFFILNFEFPCHFFGRFGKSLVDSAGTGFFYSSGWTDTVDKNVGQMTKIHYNSES